MYTYKRNNLPKQTIELVISAPWADIQTQYDSSFEQLRKNLEAEGFRKGKAPKDVAEKLIARDTVYDHLLREYIPKIYTEIVHKEEMKPVVAPKIELIKAKENEDWEIKLTTAEPPKVELGNYKEKVIEAKKEAKKAEIWVPGKDKEPSDADKEKHKQAAFQASLEALLKEVKIEISDLIIEEDVSRRLSKLVDDVQKVGLTMDAYLKSHNTSKDQIQEQARREIEESYKIEFALQEIAEKEGIKVEQAEIDRVFESIKNEKEKDAAKQNAYYYAALLRKQKTLDYLNNL